MKTKLISFCIYILLSCNVYSDNTFGAGTCATKLSADGEQEFLTFLGDSLGDFADSLAHGIVGWNAFLGSKKPDVQWRTQNLAVVGVTSL